jgi:hypothetical protein
MVYRLCCFGPSLSKRSTSTAITISCNIPSIIPPWHKKYYSHEKNFSARNITTTPYLSGVHLVIRHSKSPDLRQGFYYGASDGACLIAQKNNTFATVTTKGVPPFLCKGPGSAARRSRSSPIPPVQVKTLAYARVLTWGE